ncbi:uncharacterized beta-barrel protein YwiB (DUF1934 family) [Lactobacillus colini]|uniref:Uncharacterized beta-barrel protein YwiB (DUF1934 family) n=1 Tax=Lactobacillus colini TaxID=1819254 RepID=A0ABS4MCA9_9LACO|nr:DUF1934 domain-containing protein [Lactobacillus colini]MBP2057318.1 uncharacterized beta-barrel protein YwiB (DUF1934 family) [Lactobacillus colini]
MTNIKVKLTSTITQEDQTETFSKVGLGTIEKLANNSWRVKYNEENKTGPVPVMLMIKPHELIMQRGKIEDNNYNMMKFEPGEKKNCRIIASSKVMDLTSMTKKLDFSGEINENMQLKVEYELFSGLYLIGNYAIEIDFYPQD